MSSQALIQVKNYADPRWRTIRPADYTDIDPAVNEGYFPVQETGQGRVLVEYVQLKRVVTVQEMLEEINRRELGLPNRPEAESSFDQHPDAHYIYPVIGLCGRIVERDGRRYISYVYAHESRRGIGFRKLSSLCYDYNRFLAVQRKK
ncbi:hypothetical protein HY417_00350 [Candidatus Kaiserbacteria bacterium]|nr:hypothetical protein [Candidatus Kaiserbacteria bacterium]